MDTKDTPHEASTPLGPPLLIDAKAVALLTGLSVRTVWRFASCGKIPPPLPVGGRRLWRRAEIVEWVAAGCPRVRVEVRR